MYVYKHTAIYEARDVIWRQIHRLRIAGWLLFCCAGGLAAQDPVFSQFYAAPLHLNPAFAGTTYAPRITLNYRNQWPSWPNAYQTYAAAYEQSIEGLNSGVGFMLMADDAGDGVYNTTRFHAVYAYHLQFQSNFNIRFGIEAGAIQSRVDWDQLVFGDQLDELGNDPGFTQEQRPDNLNRTAFDVAAGILVHTDQFYGGVSVKHLNRPSESFLELNENTFAGLPFRITVHGGAEFNLPIGNIRNGPAFISPNLLYIKQGTFGQLNAGAYAGAGNFFGGLWYRYADENPDAVIGLVGVRYNIFRIGYSYDVTISQLSLAETGGTHEVSLTINFDNSRSVQAKRRSSRYNDCFKMFN